MEYKLTIQFTNGKHTTHIIDETPNNIGYRTKWFELSDGCLCLKGEKEFLCTVYPLTSIQKFEVKEIKTQIRTKDDDIYGDTDMVVDSLKDLRDAHSDNPALVAEFAKRIYQERLNQEKRARGESEGGHPYNA